MPLRFAECFEAIEERIAVDPGERGCRDLVRPGDLKRAADDLVTARSVLITTGFHIESAGTFETDGPPGALALGQALHALSIPCGYVTDRRWLAAFEAAGLSPAFSHEPPRSEELLHSFTHLVSIERPGMAADGRYYNMRGVDISRHVAPVDDLFLHASARRVRTIGIGDGGNEIGMGSVRERVAQGSELGRRIASIVPCDRLIVAGTSNWGAWGLIAAISLLHGRNLLPSEGLAREHLMQSLRAGAVDGVTGQMSESVDGLPWSGICEVLQHLHAIVQHALG